MIVAAEPVLAVEPGHVAEARRALRAQGRNVDDDAVLRLLLVARALPVALDVLADARHPRPHAPLTDVSFELFDDPAIRAARGPLVAIGHASDDGAVVVVQLVDRAALLAADDVMPMCVIRFGVAESIDSVSVVRFSL
jgi:hypothetical protein